MIPTLEDRDNTLIGKQCILFLQGRVYNKHNLLQ